MTEIKIAWCFNILAAKCKKTFRLALILCTGQLCNTCTRAHSQARPASVFLLLQVSSKLNIKPRCLSLYSDVTTPVPKVFLLLELESLHCEKKKKRWASWMNFNIEKTIRPHVGTHEGVRLHLKTAKIKSPNNSRIVSVLQLKSFPM